MFVSGFGRRAGTPTTTNVAHSRSSPDQSVAVNSMEAWLSCIPLHTECYKNPRSAPTVQFSSIANKRCCSNATLFCFLSTQYPPATLNKTTVANKVANLDRENFARKLPLLYLSLVNTGPIIPVNESDGGGLDSPGFFKTNSNASINGTHSFFGQELDNMTYNIVSLGSCSSESAIAM